MKKILILLLSLVSSVLSAYEHTGGGRLDLNLTLPEINGTIAEAGSKESVTLWYEGSFNDLVKLSLEGSLVYKGSAGFAANINKKFAYLGIEGDFYPDIKAANVYGQYDFINYRLGRQVMSDPSGLIYSHAVDGLKLGFWLGPGKLRSKIAYTGLVHYLASGIEMTRSDLINRNDTVFGSPRMIEELGWYSPELAGSYMNMDISMIAQQDLINDSDVAPGSAKMDTVYAQLRLDGFLLPFLAYKGGIVSQWGNFGDLSSTGYAADLQIYLIPPRGNSFVTAGGFLSSGEIWNHRGDYYGQNATGTQHQFMPIASAVSKGYVLSLDPGNLTSLELLVSLSKTKKFATEISTTTLMRTVNGPISSTMVIDNGKESLFIGQEALLAFRFRPVSDFGASIKTGVLYPGDSITLNEYLEPFLPVLFRLGFDLSLSF